ncbi:methyltransferase [Nannochloropsis oceanica]
MRARPQLCTLRAAAVDAGNSFAVAPCLVFPSSHVTTSSLHLAAPAARHRIHNVAAAGFENQAAMYEKTRPSYPFNSVEYVIELIRAQKLQGTSSPVLDLAAGGGKFTRLLARHPWLEVSAVEPVAAMRSVFKEMMPMIPCLEGTGDAIPFGDKHFDAVTVAQAFHWMSTLESLREIHRVLRPKGTLVLIWNMESRSAPWMGQLRDVYEQYDTHIPQYRHGEWKKVFALPEAQRLFPGPLTTRFFQQEMIVTKGMAWERVLSKSYIASLTRSEQALVRSRVDRVVEEHIAAFDLSVEDPVTGKIDRAARQPIDTEVTFIRAA